MSTKRQRRRGWRPLLEVLEDRLTPATYTVNSIADGGTGSGLAGDLRYCITQADANAGSTIVFDAAVFGTPQTIYLNGAAQHQSEARALPDLSANTQINGPATGVTVHALYWSRMFVIDAGATVTIFNLTISGGSPQHDPQSSANEGGGIDNLGTLTLNNCTVSGNDAGEGGGINNRGTLTLSDCSVTENNASDGGGINNSGVLTLTNCTLTANSAEPGSSGAGIANSGTATLVNCTVSRNYTAYGGMSGSKGGGLLNTGALTLVNCTLSGNNAGGSVFDGGGRGGGLYNDGAATLVNCTLSGNVADGSSQVRNGGAGVGGSGGGIANSGALTLTNCTLSGNTAASGTVTVDRYPGQSFTEPGDGGGLTNSGSATLRNTIVAGNAAAAMPDVSGGGSLTAAYSLIRNAAGVSFTADSNHNLTGPDPLLAPLGNYGGPTQTMPPLPGSPALDAGSNALALDAGGRPLTADQRGLSRFVNGAVDIGSFESQGFTLTALAGANQSTPAGTAYPAALAVRVTANNAAEPVAGGFVTFTAPGSGPSGTFANGQATATATIDAGGTATAPLTANGIAGPYAVSAATAGAPTPAGFPLDNLAVGSVSGPLNPTQRYVAHLYEDLLGRSASPAEVNFFSTLVDQGLLTRDQLAQFFLQSFEFFTHQVDQIYVRLLGRHAEPAALALDAAFLAAGGRMDQLEAVLLGSDEYFRLHGGTDAGFLAGLGPDVLGGPLGPADAALFQAELAAGTPRYVIAIQALGEPQAAVVEAEMLYQRTLHRSASAAELAYPASLLLGGSDTAVLLGLLLSPEYAGRP